MTDSEKTAGEKIAEAMEVYVRRTSSPLAAWLGGAAAKTALAEAIDDALRVYR